MRFLISFLILVGFVRCETYLSTAEVCSEDTQLINVIREVNTSVSGPSGINNYYYEEWTNSESGSNRVLLYDKDAAFRAEWDDPDDFLGRVGARWPDKTGEEYPEYGNMVAEYTYTRSGEGTAGARYNFIGVYGWAYENEVKGIPLVEFYIIDDWFGNDNYSETDPIPESTACHDSPADWVCQKGSFNVDGAEYKIYTNWRRNAPNIAGAPQDFIQYFSIRQSYRKCGKITISEHFKKWDSLNLKLGNLFEASLLVEVQKGKGFIDYTHARVLTNVPDSDLEITPGSYAPPCSDRSPVAGICTHPRDVDDPLTPPCYARPDDTCSTSCPIDYEPGTSANSGKCVPKTYNAQQQCLDRPVQTSDCKNETYDDASCDQFGCGPSCYLNARHTKCSLTCSEIGEVAATGTGKYCELKPCSSRTPQTVAHSSSSHSASNAVANYDVVISVKDVLFKAGWKSGATVKFTINGDTQTSSAQVGDGVFFTINEELKWFAVAPDKLTSVGFWVNPLTTTPVGTINISNNAYKVNSIAEGIDKTFSYHDPNGPLATYSNTYTLNYKVAVLVPSTSFRCGLPTESPPCYLEGNACVPACDAANTGDDNTGNCVPPQGGDASTLAARWGWALCLLFMMLIL